MPQTTDNRSNVIMRAYLLALITVTGAAVLALEVLGTRVIGVRFGSSMYVWAALLSVTLVCLAIGYAVGGRLADRMPRPWALFALVALAGASVLLVGPMTAVLAPLGERFGLAWGAMASAMVIFFLPLTLLAMASPYVIRLRARSLEGVGGASGGVYALSTIGSVAGVAAVAFWMIPILGTPTSLSVCSGALMGLGAIGLAIATRWRAAPLLLLPVAALLARPDHQPLPGELYHTESAYGELRVVQREGEGEAGMERMLMVNGSQQTGMPLDIYCVDAGSILQSIDYYLELLPYFYGDLADGRRGVLIGLAGGMFARVMEFYKIDWTAVEIDVKVAELAKAYFGYRGEIHYPDGRRHDVDLARFPRRKLPEMYAEHAEDNADVEPYRGRAVIQDGRGFLASMTEPVDFVVVDAYSSDVIPFHLITREFFALIRSRLTDDGILAINYIGRPGGDVVTDSLFRTLASVFGADRLLAYRSDDDPSAVQVVIIFALQPKAPAEPTPLWDISDGADELSFRLASRKLTIAPTAGAVITDALNPIDRDRAETALEWRRETMEELHTAHAPAP